MSIAQAPKKQDPASKAALEKIYFGFSVGNVTGEQNEQPFQAQT
jgi:hypothetical protein